MTVHVSYLFSRNKKIGSKLISWSSGLLLKGMNPVPSHVAVLLEFEGVNQPLVIESVLESGVRLAPYESWKRLNEELYKVKCTQGPRCQKKVFAFIDELWGKKYDWFGILYFAWRFILHFLFKIKFPSENKWESIDRFFCTEAAAKIAHYDKYSMVTPAKMCWDFLKQADGDIKKS